MGISQYVHMKSSQHKLLCSAALSLGLERVVLEERWWRGGVERRGEGRGKCVPAR